MTFILNVELSKHLFSYKVQGKKFGNEFAGEIDLASLPNASVEKLISYGVQRFINDATGGKGAEEIKEIIEDKLKALELGEFRRMGGGKQVDALTKELRILVVEKMVESRGWKVAEAQQLVADDPKAAFQLLIAKKLGAKRGVHESKIPQDEVSAQLDKLWPGYIAKAQEIVDLRNSKEDDEDDELDLSI